MKRFKNMIEMSSGPVGSGFPNRMDRFDEDMERILTKIDASNVQFKDLGVNDHMRVIVGVYKQEPRIVLGIDPSLDFKRPDFSFVDEIGTDIETTKLYFYSSVKKDDHNFAGDLVKLSGQDVAYEMDFPKVHPKKARLGLATFAYSAMAKRYYIMADHVQSTGSQHVWAKVIGNRLAPYAYSVLINGYLGKIEFLKMINGSAKDYQQHATNYDTGHLEPEQRHDFIIGPKKIKPRRMG